MAIQSMTGFARVADAVSGRAFAWEIRSVNGRGLDIRLRTPPGFDSLAEEARKRLASACSRGTLHVTLTLASAATTRAVRLNTELLQQLIDTVSDVKALKGLGAATLDGLLQVRGVVEAADEDPLALVEELKAPLMAAFERCVGEFIAARESEGRALAAVLLGQIDQIAALAQQIEAHPARSLDAIRARLGEQVALMLGSAKGLDSDRLHQEAALLATKADVREELDRLAAHVVSARELITGSGAAGRRLDFLAQEFGRESSTLCAKANDVALSRIGLDLRAIVDQLREQVQNVE